MIRNLIFVLFALASVSFITGCSKTEEVEVTNDAGVVIERFTRDKETFARQGRTQLFAPDGTLLEESNYQNDTLQGERKLYYETGELQYLENYKKGQYNGPYRAFHRNGQVLLEGQYVNNEMTGVWKRFYSDGQLKEEVHFENNQENGPFVEYHPNGQLKAKGSYLGGDFEHGPLELYNEQGVLIKKMNCDKGICRTSWTKDGEAQ